MEWWQIALAALEGLLLLLLAALWFDTLRERTGWTLRRAAKAAGFASLGVPVGALAVLVTPLWVAIIVVAVTALVIGAMAVAS